MKSSAICFCLSILLFAANGTAVGQRASLQLIGEWEHDIEMCTKLWKKQDLEERQIAVRVKAFNHGKPVHKFKDDGTFEIKFGNEKYRAIPGKYSIRETESGVTLITLTIDSKKEMPNRELQVEFEDSRMIWNRESTTPMVFKRVKRSVREEIKEEAVEKDAVEEDQAEKKNAIKDGEQVKESQASR